MLVYQKICFYVIFFFFYETILAELTSERASTFSAKIPAKIINFLIFLNLIRLHKFQIY